MRGTTTSPGTLASQSAGPSHETGAGPTTSAFCELLAETLE